MITEKALAEENYDGGIAFTAFDYTLEIRNLRHHYKNFTYAHELNEFSWCFLYSGFAQKQNLLEENEKFFVHVESWKLWMQRTRFFPLKFPRFASHYRQICEIKKIDERSWKSSQELSIQQN